MCLCRDGNGRLDVAATKRLAGQPLVGLGGKGSPDQLDSGQLQLGEKQLDADSANRSVVLMPHRLPAIVAAKSY